MTDDLPASLSSVVFEWLYHAHDALEAAIADEEFRAAIEHAARLIFRSLKDGGQILIAGNGGSQAQAQHFAAELVGRFQCDGWPLPAVALGADPTILTAVANDYGFERVFERQLCALARPEGVLVAISTSGQSANILRAAANAKTHGMSVIAMTGRDGQRLIEHSTCAIVAPISETPLVQQLHLVAVHAICAIVETAALRRFGSPNGFGSSK